MRAVVNHTCAPAPSSLRRVCAPSHDLKITLRGDLALSRRTNHKRSEAGNEAAFPMPLACYAVTFLALTSALLTSARAANPNLGLVQDLHVLPVPAGAVQTCFVGSTSRRHASVDAVTSTVLAVDRVPTAKISVSDNSIGSARARGEKGRTPRTPIHRLAFTRRQARCKRSDDLSRHSRRVWSCGTMNRVKADAVRVLCLKRFLN